ncbi:MAG: hypothetical protein GC184_06175 [Rhizobiales bacterium]|nr:hypothetical protein [Hyphomicrobiales bacterium]
MTEAKNPVLAAMDAARANAAALASNGLASNGVATGGSVPAVQTHNPGGTMVQHQAGGVPMTADDAMLGSFNVEKWLKVSEHGIQIDGSPNLDEVEVDINLPDVLYCMAVKFGNPAQYLKTYDRVHEAKGGSWAAAIDRAMAADASCRGAYKSADIPMRVANPVESPKKGDDTILATPDDVLGYSMSTTGMTEWINFLKKVKQAGLDEASVRVKLGFKKREGKGNTWGVFTFTLVGETPVDAE